MPLAPDQQRTDQVDPQIVFVWSLNPADGAPHQMMASLWLVKLGYRVLCIGEGPPNVKSIEYPLGQLRTHLLPRGTGMLRRLAWQLRLTAHLFMGRFGRYKRALFYIQGPNVTPAALLALAGVNSERIVYHTQDFLEPGRHRVWEFFERRLACRAGTVIANEPNRARFMASHYALRQQPLTVRTALPVQWPWPQFDVGLRGSMLTRLGYAGDDARLIVHFGPLSAVRCGEQIAVAIGQLPRNYLLVLTGVEPGSTAESSTFQLLRQSDIEARTIAYPNVDYDMLQQIGAVCDIGLLLYPDDGIGNFYQAPGRLSEYLRCGLAIVLPDYPNMELLNLQHGIGAVCNAVDAESVAAALLTLGERDVHDWEAQRLRNITCARNLICYDRNAVKLEKRVAELLKFKPAERQGI